MTRETLRECREALERGPRRRVRAVGIFGHHVYVNPREQLGIVVWQALPKPLTEPPVHDYDLFAALAGALR